jgi:general secretion pathway protein K
MRPRQRGFVLVLTLWVLAAIAIAAAYFGERVQASLRLATARQAQTDTQIAQAEAQAEVLYRLAMVSTNQLGLGDPPHVIRLDGRPYLDGGVLVQLQDNGGLIDLNGFSDAFMKRALAGLGVPERAHDSLVDALRDYVDTDDLRRLNGAEAADYRALGRPDLPHNDILSTPLELRDVAGWAQQSELWLDNRVLDVVTTAGDGRLNPNTAPAAVLMALPNITPDLAQAFIARRELEPITAAWLDRVLGTRFDGVPSAILAFPLQSIRVTQRMPGQPGALRYNVELTPKGNPGHPVPWQINYFYRLERLLPDPGPDQLSAAPTATSPPPPAHAPAPARFPPRPTEPASAPRLLAN